MAIACKLCIMTKGLKGNEIPTLPQTEEEMYEHIESVHHIPVVRVGESQEEALIRFKHKYPEEP